MATSLADLLDALTGQAGHPAPTGDATAPSDPVDADRAIALLGRVLHRLADDGLSSIGGGDRARWVAEAARACDTAATGPDPASAGRLTQLAAAVSDALSLLREDLGLGNRWAVATAVVDALVPLIPVAEAGDLPVERRRDLIVAGAAATIVARSAALDPPTGRDSAPLDRAIPQPALPLNQTVTAGAALTDAIAGLEYATRPDAGPIPVAAYLAVCTSVEALCRTASALPHNADTGLGLSRAARSAALGWAAARVVLNPFDDGSRRPQQVPPPAAGYALQLHRALRGTSDRVPLAGAVRDAVQRIPTIADHLHTALTDWAAAGRVLAYARDLPPRDTRVAEYLAGYHAPGIVRADRRDLAPARQALDGARTLSTGLAAHAAHPATVVSHLGAANRERRAQLTDHHLHAATADARRALHTFTGPPRGGRGPRP